jgi:F-type H+-transporting ATPase subunit epsilon
MAKTFKLEVVTPEGSALTASASALQAPAWEGYLGVLAGHAPMLCVLKAGVLTVTDEAGRKSFFALKGGFMEVTQERVIVLADAIERADEVDVKAAEKAIADASGPLPATTPAPGASREQQKAARDVAQEEREDARRWAEARLHAVDRKRESA